MSDSDSSYEPGYKRRNVDRHGGAARAAGGERRHGGEQMQNRLLIDGQWVESQSGKKFDTVNPATGEVITQVYEGDKADVDLAVRAARRAFETEWKYTDGSRRRDLMLRLADLMEEYREELATLETLDNGKPYSESLNVDLVLGVKCFRYYAGWADKVQGKTCPVDGKFFSVVKHEPVGVCGQIIPWNFPLLMAVWKLAPALAMGCTVVLKPAEQTPLSCLRLGELIVQAGYPAGVVNIIPGFGPTAGNAISTHPDIDKVAFTGSTEVGRIVMCAASKSLKRCSLELGGKSALVIMDDADLDAAVASTQAGIFFNQGQVCTASSRVFVHERVYEEYTQKLLAATKKRTQGNGFNEVNMGPQVSEEQWNTVYNYIKKGKEEGARVLTGGKKVGDRGYFIAPTIFTDVTDDMTIAKEEIFGPVMCLLKFRDLDDVIKRANKNMYGLAAGIFTRDLNRALKYANRVKAGTVWVNTYNAFDTAQPFGGFKASGNSRELGEYGLELYTEPKTIMIALDDAPVKP